MHNIPRYGIKWNGAENPVVTKMNDGYWTPWHLANDAIMKLQIEVDVQSYWGLKWEAEHAEIDLLRAELENARGLVAEWGAYAPEYFQEKHDLAGDLERLDTIIFNKNLN